MPIYYALHENQLTSDPNDYLAMIKPVDTADQERVITRMLERGTTVSRADIVSVLEVYHDSIVSLLAEGNNIVTPLANFSVSLKGVFQGLADSYAPGRHQLLVNARPGARLKNRVLSSAQVVKTEPGRPRPTPTDFIDVQSGERNAIVTPGGMSQLLGHRLKFDLEDPVQGVFFIAADGTEHRASIIGRNKPGELMFMTPPLPAGEYTLEVRTRAREADAIRSGVLEATLTAG